MARFSRVRRAEPPRAPSPSLSPVKTLRTRGAGRPSSPSPEPDVVGEEHIPEESIADLAGDGSGSDDAFRPGSQSTGGLGGTSGSPPTRSPRSSTGSDAASWGHHPHSPLELHPPAHAVISPPKKKGVGVGVGAGGSSGGGSKRTSSPGSSSVSEIPSPETSIHTDAYSEDDFEAADGTESAASSRARSAGSTGESPSLSGEAESLLGVLHSHLLGEALDDDRRRRVWQADQTECRTNTRGQTRGPARGEDIPR